MSDHEAGTVAALPAIEVVVLNRDLFFGVQIGNVLRGLGYRVTFMSETAAFAAHLRSARPAPVLGIIDMSAGVNWGELGAMIADPTVATPVLAFGSHLDVEGRRAAKRAGVTRLVSNGEFHRDMVKLVRRYALAPGATVAHHAHTAPPDAPAPRPRRTSALTRRGTPS